MGDRVYAQLKALVRAVSEYSGEPVPDRHLTGRRLWYGRSILVLILSAALTVLMCAPIALATDYVYDNNGRLVVVRNDAGQSARYVYDIVGNLERIEPLAADDLVLFGFSPRIGAPGTQVVIRGNGFVTDTTQNDVKFNGVAAAANAATTSELTVTVPASATTGPISVSVGGEIVTSSSDFIVDSSAISPIVTGMSPQIVSIGQQVTLTGENFMPGTGPASIELNGRPVEVVSLTDSQAVFAAPAHMGSGRVSVVTAFGTGQADQDLVVLPEGITPADVDVVRRLDVGGASEMLSVSASGRFAIVLFDADVDDLISMQASGLSATASIKVDLYMSNGVHADSDNIADGDLSVHLPPLPLSGTQLLVLKSDVGASWSMALEAAADLEVNGSMLAFDVDVPGQSRRALVAGPRKIGLGLAGTAAQVTGAGNSVRLDVHDVQAAYDSGSNVVLDGVLIGYAVCEPALSGCDVNAVMDPDGMYTVTASATDQSAFSIDAIATDDYEHDLLVDTISNLVLSRPGQNARLYVTAQAGETYAFTADNQATDPAGKSIHYAIYGPDGSLFDAADISGSVTMNMPNLSQAGRYTVFVDPVDAATLSMQVTLISGAEGQLPIDGSTTSFSTQASGQSVSATFVASQGQNLGLGVSNVVASSGGVQVSVTNPSGVQLSYQDCYSSDPSCSLNLTGLDAGEYEVLIEPMGTGAISFDVTLSEDVTGALSSTPMLVDIASIEQNARLSFSGQSGQSINLNVEEFSYPYDDVYVRVYGPDGGLAYNKYLSGDGPMLLSDLPQTGTYIVVVDPYYGSTMSMRLSVSVAAF